jgi:DNA modification methylase
MDAKIEVKNLPADALIPYARNARTHSEGQVKQIAASIREFGFNNPILIRDDLTVIAGHGRLAAAKVLGLKEVPTISLSHLTPLQVRAYVLADNKLALNAGWDDEMLTVELKDLEMEGFDVSLTGFDEIEVSSLLAENTEEGLTDDDEVPSEVVNPVTRPGDIWVLGRHRVMCGDSLSSESVSKLLDGKLADLWITDPPYNVAYVGKTEDAMTIENDSMGDTEFRDFLRGAYTAADSNMREGAVFYIWHADSEGYNFRGAAFDVGWKVRQCIIWSKSAFVMGRQDYQWKHEPCLYGWKDGSAHFWGSDRKQTTVLEFDRPNRNGEHPTMKPVDLFAYQIGNSSQEGEAVLDSFGGSGTTLIACEKLNRKAYLMELDPKYCDVIVKRWQDFTGKKAVLESNGKTFDELKAK